MTFDEVLAQVQDLLQREKRVSYRGLKRRFALDDEYLEDLKEELIGAKRLAADENGRFLVWLTDQGTVPISSQSPAPPADPRLAEGERRQLTVMFCDLVDSTNLSALLDPEELREVVRAYHETCADAISRYGGYTAQHLGDGLLVYFGYPAAHEDDAQRAVRTGLEILAGLTPLNAQLQSSIKDRVTHPIQARIGIHTGLVVVGEIGSSAKREILALGETPNLAARIQAQAAPDEVIIGAATRRLVEGLFVCEDRGEPELKGITTPVGLYRVVRDTEAQSRFDVAVRAGLTPLVGREEELALLRSSWAKAASGEGQVVLLSGEPGIGKSRLVQELRNHVVQDGAVRIEFRCSPYHQNSAFYPLITHLQQVLHIVPSDTPHTRLEKLEQTLASYSFPQGDTVPLLAGLLSLPRPEAAPSLNLTPQQQKQKTIGALVRWLFEEAERASVYTVWEDLHWADPSTLEFLALCLDQVPTTRILMVVTFRPEFTPAWASRWHVSHLVLSRLAGRQTGAIVEQISRGKGLPSEIQQQIVAKTDGVPLFVEEMTKSVIESLGDVREAPLPLEVPATLRDSLMARLDRLGTAKEVAQQGAVVGREVTYELLRAISPLAEAPLQQELTRLVGAELLYQRGRPPQATYLFKHALVQEAAYESLLKSRRQQYHHQIAQTLGEQFPETKDVHPELLGHHYTEAGLRAEAIPYWQQAGERAVKRSAYVEAVSHFTQGLELLKLLPDAVERIQEELTLQFALCEALAVTKGYASQEVGKAWARALELCRQIGETPELLRVLLGLAGFHMIGGPLRKARELGEQGVSVAQKMGHPVALLWAHCVLGEILLWLGELVSSREHINEALALYDLQKSSFRTLPGVHHPGVGCLSVMTCALWSLGYPEQALQKTHDMLALAQELDHPFSRALALNFAAMLHSFRREEQATQERAEELLALSTEHGFPHRTALGTIQRGWALSERGQTEEGIEQIRRGLGAFRATGQGIGTCVSGFVACGYRNAGQIEEGLGVLAKALAAIEESDRIWEAELYRLRGELTLAQSSVQSPGASVQKEAEECFRKAIEVARKQQAKSLELRAVTSLGRLLEKQGKKDEARRELAEIYGWFTEGFGTVDLKEAKALLEELS